jgi:hypothetical protein
VPLTRARRSVVARVHDAALVEQGSQIFEGERASVHGALPDLLHVHLRSRLTVLVSLASPPLVSV